MKKELVEKPQNLPAPFYFLTPSPNRTKLIKQTQSPPANGNNHNQNGRMKKKIIFARIYLSTKTIYIPLQ